MFHNTCKKPYLSELRPRPGLIFKLLSLFILCNQDSRARLPSGGRVSGWCRTVDACTSIDNRSKYDDRRMTKR
eukprot:6188519-Pleurochrysis_carterae.AAC.1